MKNIRWTILAALILAAPNVAHAQRPDDASAQTAPGTTGATTDAGSISNAGGTSTDTSMTQTTQTTTPGMDTMSDTTMLDETTSMPNTGGEPLIMSLAGMSLAAGAFFLRRRVLS